MDIKEHTQLQQLDMELKELKKKCEEFNIKCEDHSGEFPGYYVGSFEEAEELVHEYNEEIRKSIIKWTKTRHIIYCTQFLKVYNWSACYDARIMRGVPVAGAVVYMHYCDCEDDLFSYMVPTSPTFIHCYVSSKDGNGWNHCSEAVEYLDRFYRLGNCDRLLVFCTSDARGMGYSKLRAWKLCKTNDTQEYRDSFGYAKCRLRTRCRLDNGDSMPILIIPRDESDIAKDAPYVSKDGRILYDVLLDELYGKPGTGRSYINNNGARFD